jgi:hypothetical protein
MDKLATIPVYHLTTLLQAAVTDTNRGELEYDVEQAHKAGSYAEEAANSVHTKSIFCKVFNIISYGLQVLVSKKATDDVQFPNVLRFETRIEEGLLLKVLEIGYSSRQEREEAFYRVDEDGALKFLKSINNLKPL